MSTCSEYKVTVPAGSPADKLYAELKAQPYSVTDEDFDRHGYHVVDYANPGKPPSLRGDGNCVVTEKEVTELALDDKKYQKPFEKAYGHRIFYLLNDKNKKDKKYLKTFDDFVKLVDAKLKLAGLSREGDEYKIAKARAIFYYHLLPAKKYLSKWPEAQKEHLKNEIENALAISGLKEVAGYLLQKGGDGYQHTMSSLAYEPATFQFLQGYPLSNGHLYGLYEYAGLSPDFVEVYGADNDDQYKCGAQLLQRFVVGIKLNAGYKLFDAVFHNQDVRKEYYYPLHRRHMFDARNFNEQWLDKIIELRDSGSMGDITTPEEISFTYIFSYAISVMKHLSKIEDKDEKARHPMTTMLCNPSVSVTSNNPYFLLMLGTFCSSLLERDGFAPELFQDTLPFIRGETYNMASFMELGAGNYEKAIGYAAELLKLDGECDPAYDVIAMASYKLGRMDEAERYFKIAEGLAVEPKDHLGNFYAQWGKLHLEKGEFKEAADSFSKYLQVRGEKNDSDDSFGVKVDFFLAVALERIGNKEEADGVYERMFEETKGYVGVDLKKTGEISGWLDEQVAKHKPTNSAVARVYSYLGRVYLYHRQIDAAKTMAEKAAAIDKDNQDMLILKGQIEIWTD